MDYYYLITSHPCLMGGMSTTHMLLPSSVLGQMDRTLTPGKPDSRAMAVTSLLISPLDNGGKLIYRRKCSIRHNHSSTCYTVVLYLISPTSRPSHPPPSCSESILSRPKSVIWRQQKKKDGHCPVVPHLDR